MSDDIEKLINSMKYQYIQMREEYEKEYKSIIQEFDNERNAILDRNKQEINDLFHLHKEIETKYLEQRQKEEESNAKQLEDVMSQDANKQNE